MSDNQVIPEAAVEAAAIIAPDVHQRAVARHEDAEIEAQSAFIEWRTARERDGWS